MKIAITSNGSDLKDKIDSRFGRCSYFIFVDTDTDKFEAVENPNVQGMGGVGIQSAQMMTNKKIEAVLTGNCGPNAFQALQAAGIKVITGVTGIVQEAIDKYKSGELKVASKSNVSGHFGIGPGKK